MSVVKNILIDLDGTLTDPKVGITTSARYGLNKVGFCVAEHENIDWIIGPPLKASLAKIINVDVNHDLAEQALQGYRERFSVIGLFENELYPHVKSTLQALQTRGYRLYLATAKPHVYAVRILEHFDLLKYFIHPYGSELTGERTNKGDLIRYILGQEQLDPAQCIMVGDREHDILGARRNGIETIAVEYGYGTQQELDLATPKYRIQSFDQVLKIITEHEYDQT